MSFLTAYLTSRWQWKRTRQDTRDEARRAAIKGALKWIDPMYAALSTAELQTFRLFSQFGDVQEFEENYPNLLQMLPNFDLPEHHRLLLPPHSYESGAVIVRGLEGLKYEALDLWANVHDPHDSPAIREIDARQQCSARADVVRKQIDGLQEELARAYQQTYE